ncbi:MAG: FAD-dependent thymidylate synthase [Alphaproteobacteria bacterium]|nr:FAD-dependent thymidylate synthase [Alphaproteobacteria bacterium]
MTDNTEIFVIDNQTPEDIAMLQALYSRSPASVVSHLEKLKASGSGKFMSQYYVGYGHASIGDCGNTTVFIEQVSMLCAKTIQDNPLYNGQEASTRYLDFSKQEVLNPFNTPLGAEIQKKWMQIYNEVLPKLNESLKKEHPFDKTEYKNERIWENTIYARAFDIARSLLPVGTTTLLSWTTSLRAARDNLKRLKYNPLPEVREVSTKILKALIEKYPHSFDVNDLNENSDSYYTEFSEKNAFITKEAAVSKFCLTAAEIEEIKSGRLIHKYDTINAKWLLDNESGVIKKRPKYAPLPRRLDSYGRYNMLFLLDFGSFRDIQRHRNGVCPIPLIDGAYGMHSWYMQQFSDYLSSNDNKELLSKIKEQEELIKTLPNDAYLKQYYYPMGTNVLVHASYTVPEAVYIGEIRSYKTVHPTLRPIAQSMLRMLQQDFPDIAVYGDMDENSWNAKRGEQTIIEKGK